MEDYRLITTADGVQTATATDGGIRYDITIIGRHPLDYKTMERATAAAIAADDMEQATKDSLVADGYDITGRDIIVTATEKGAELSPSFAIVGTLADIIVGHTIDMARIVAQYEDNKTSTALAEHMSSIRRLADIIIKQYKTPKI